MQIAGTTEGEPVTDFLIIGAGLAGLAFAREAVARGRSVLLLDKGRGVGGRAATRRWGDTLRVDHGAQFFTAKAPKFRAFVDEWLAEPDPGLAVWAYGFPMWRDGRIEERPAGHPRYAPVRGMSELPSRLGAGLNAETGVTVKRVERDGHLWRASGEAHGGGAASFAGRTLVLNLPPAQLLPLAAEFLPQDERDSLAEVEYEPAWTLLLRLAADVPGAAWPAVDAAAGGHPTLAWVSRDHTKRRDPAASPVLIAHGSGAWSRAHLEDDPADVGAALTAAVVELVGGALPEVLDAQTHRWRYATAVTPYPERSLFLPERALMGCGDWCDVGGRVEGALTSGWDLAERVFGGKEEGAAPV
jgi:predicted NAD/FAD-dependent oxidoreductase